MIGEMIAETIAAITGFPDSHLPVDCILAC